ncbi:hypothetical protein MBLNU13_g02844t2 [Cladosporium sp. NU13]
MQTSSMAQIQGSQRARHEDLDARPRNWREYNNITVGDQASMIAGDVHGNVHFTTVNHRDMILNSLHFPGMEHYHERPLESHSGTFDWIFDQRTQLHVCGLEDPWRPGQCVSEQECDQIETDLRKHASKLQTWLETSEDIFWVQGKAGSGKSTFMKFLFEHEQTQMHLRRWAGGDVVTAAFFFWGAGSSELERSYIGLLRGLLFQVLQERPELIELVLPGRFHAVVRSTAYKKPWTKRELGAAFDLLLQAPETNSRFCFFVDGLDEFEGDHHDLIDAIRSLGKSPTIKICVSSRPWSLFQEEYGSNDDLQVALQMLTRRDINHYVTSRLTSTACEAHRTSEMKELGNTVCQRSEGVFLWVSLAVKDLRRGIDGHDSIEMLQDRLEAYPSELQKFLQHIFDGIDPVYRRLTARVLLMMLEPTAPVALTSLPSLEESFTADGRYIVKPRWSPKNDMWIERLTVRAALCANNWCRDLLEQVNTTDVESRVSSVLKSGSSSLDLHHAVNLFSYLSFGHRSVHHFAKEKAKDGTLSLMAGNSFDPRLAWLYVFVNFSRWAPDYVNFVEVVTDALQRLTGYASNPHELPHFDRKRHELLSFAGRDDDLAIGILQCLQAFDSVGQDITKRYKRSHWTSGRFSNSDPPSSRRPSDKRCSNLVSYLVSLIFPDYIIGPLLTQQSGSLTELQKQFIIETSLEPYLYRDTKAGIMLPEKEPAISLKTCSLGHPIQYCAIVVQVIESGIDVNRPTQRTRCCQDYSVWQIYLLWLHDYFHELPEIPELEDHTADHDDCHPEKGLKLIKDTLEVFRAFLIYGADPFAVISSADLIESYDGGDPINRTTRLSVADVVSDLRTAATSDLACFQDHHAWFATRLEVVGEFEKLLHEVLAQERSAPSHGSFLGPTA